MKESTAQSGEHPAIRRVPRSLRSLRDLCGFRWLSPRLGAFLAVLFWGVSFVATKAAVTECGPLALIVARTGIGAALLLMLLGARREALLPPRDAWVGLGVMGFVGVAFHQVLQAYALTLTTASTRTR